MIADELRKVLVCPTCKGKLTFEESRVICPACRKVYPIKEGIPSFIPQDAQDLDKS